MIPFTHGALRDLGFEMEPLRGKCNQSPRSLALQLAQILFHDADLALQLGP